MDNLRQRDEEFLAGMPLRGYLFAKSTEGGQARLSWGSWIPGNLSWPVRCPEGRFQPELFGRAADPIRPSVGPAASHTATHCLRLREYFGKNSDSAAIGLIASQAEAAG